jgi:hypothetical protein
LEQFREVWVHDFEFSAPDGERPAVICLVARELRSGRTMRFWREELLAMQRPPYPVDDECLFVAFYASAEMSCHLALGWPLPSRVLDLFAEFRNLTNGITLPKVGGKANSLLCALAFFGINGIGFEEKEEMRQLAIRGGPWNTEEQAALLNYCESDVVALERLLPVMLPRIHLPLALHRGRYMRAAARMEYAGVPIDVCSLDILRRYWPEIQTRLITAVDTDFHVYEGTTFKRDNFERWVRDRGIAWPRHPSGEPMLDSDTFSDMAKVHLAIAPLAELRHALSALRLETLAVGADGRNRCLLSAFAAKTGRNQPSNSKFIFGPSKWLRSLIQPPPGYAVAYIDWEQQEIGIAAKLSGDEKMMAAYCSGDFYLASGKQAGIIPPEGTKRSHKTERNQFKGVSLGVLYGMGEATLAYRIGQPTARARELLELHRRTYPAFWRWSEAAVDHAMLFGHLDTVFGWRLHAASDSSPCSLRNYPVQANAAEMMRTAACLATERGIPLCAPVHDAFVVMGEEEVIEAVVASMQQAMAEASRIVLDGFELRSDVTTVKFPDRYSDERGVRMWNTVWRIIAELDQTVGDMSIRVATEDGA